MVKGRKPLLTTEMRLVINDMIRRHQDWSVRTIVEKIPEWDRRFAEEKKGWTVSKHYPGRTVVNNYLSPKKPNELDKPWRISTLPGEIPPQSLPAVLELFIEKLREQAVHITVREALWIARLAFVLKDKEQLWEHALMYAWSERGLEALGLDYTEIGDDALLYEAMKREKEPGFWLSADDMTDIRSKAALAQIKQKRMESKRQVRERSPEPKPESSVTASLDGKEIYRKPMKKEASL